MASKNILEEFFDKKELAILKVFLFEENDKFYLREVAKKSKVPNATTFRIVAKLKKIGIVEETLIKKTKLYSLAANKATKQLSELFEEKKTILEEFVETVSQVPGVHMIVGHGEDQKDKTNIIIIGENVDTKVINEKIGEIKYKYDYTIIPLVVNPQEFNKLAITGSISDKKTIIWEKSSEEAQNGQ
jgi:predicted DNA-binding transcriptional regulator